MAAILLAGLQWLATEPRLLAATKVHNESATPVTITLVGADPDSPTLTVPVTIFFRTTGGRVGNSWSLSVQSASGPTMLNCPTPIPIDKIQVSCVSTIADDGAAAATCAAPFNLSTGLQTISSGTEGAGNARPYETVINVTLLDSWRYIATDTSCTINLNYQIIAD